MDWNFEGVNVRTSKPLVEYADERLRRVLNRMGGWVRSGTLRFRDTDQSDLEAGRHVKVVVSLANGATVVFDEPTRDFYAGIDRVAERLKRHLRQRLDKHRCRRRGQHRQLAMR